MGAAGAPRRQVRAHLTATTPPLAGLAPGERLQPLISQARLQARVSELAQEIDAIYAGRPLHLLAVLKGAFVFAADLMRQITGPTTIDFVSAASYGTGMRSSGNVALAGLDRLDIVGRDVLVVEDILDTGRTAALLIPALRERAPASVALLPLLRKPAAIGLDLPVPIVGFDIDDEFVVGYGMDYSERCRHLPCIYRLSLGN